MLGLRDGLGRLAGSAARSFGEALVPLSLPAPAPEIFMACVGSSRWSSSVADAGCVGFRVRSALAYLSASSPCAATRRRRSWPTSAQARRWP